MGGKGSGRRSRWSEGKQHVSLHYNFSHGNSLDKLSVYIPADEFGVLQHYAWSINMDHTTLIKTYIAEYLCEKINSWRIPGQIRMKPGFKRITDYLYHIIMAGLEKDADFQKYKKEYQEAI